MKYNREKMDRATKVFMIEKLGIPLLTIFILAFVVPVFMFDDHLLKLILSSYLGDETRVALMESVLEGIGVRLDYMISFFIILSLLKFFRKSNKEKYFNANGTIYYDAPYFFFWVASTVLGYEKIQLAGIPLYLQYKLVLRGTFQAIIPDMWNDHYTKGDIDSSEIEVRYHNINEISEAVNVLIADTYNIEMKDLSEEYKNTPTIVIRNKSLDAQRKINKPLIENVRSEVVKLTRKYKEIYVFSTANPINNINIINSSFRFFGRANNLRLYVVQKDDAQEGKYAKSYKIF